MTPEVFLIHILLQSIFKSPVIIPLTIRIITGYKPLQNHMKLQFQCQFINFIGNSTLVNPHKATPKPQFLLDVFWDPNATGLGPRPLAWSSSRQTISEFLHPSNLARAFDMFRLVLKCYELIMFASETSNLEISLSRKTCNLVKCFVNPLAGEPWRQFHRRDLWFGWKTKSLGRTPDDGDPIFTKSPYQSCEKNTYVILWYPM